MLMATIDDLLSWQPCDDVWTSEKILAAAGDKTVWTALDVLALEDVSPGDRLWVVLRKELIEEVVLWELACQFAEHVLPCYERVYPGDFRPRDAIAKRRLWIDSAEDPAAARAAAAAAWAAGEAEERRWQIDCIRRELARDQRAVG